MGKYQMVIIISVCPELPFPKENEKIGKKNQIYVEADEIDYLFAHIHIAVEYETWSEN